MATGDGNVTVTDDMAGGDADDTVSGDAGVDEMVNGAVGVNEAMGVDSDELR